MAIKRYDTTTARYFYTWIVTNACISPPKTSHQAISRSNCCCSRKFEVKFLIVHIVVRGGMKTMMTTLLWWWEERRAQSCCWCCIVYLLLLLFCYCCFVSATDTICHCCLSVVNVACFPLESEFFSVSSGHILFICLCCI